jgi:hypothetical protein
MSKDELAALLQPKTFRPFRVQLADGDSAEIPHPEFAALSPAGESLVVFNAKTGHVSQIIDTYLIVSANFGTPAAG